MRRLDKEQLLFLEETSRQYEWSLMENQAALSYLAGRSVSMESADRFRFGLVVDPPPEHKSMAGRLAIPTIKGVGITGFEFKCIRDECIIDKSVKPWIEKHEGHGKYMSYEPQALYNVAALDTDKGYIALCEGRLDAVTLDGECGIPTVGLPGTSGWKAHGFWRRLLKDFHRVYIFEDNDAHLDVNVGKKLGEQISAELSQAVRVELPILEEGKSSDPNYVFCKKGRQYLRELIGLKGD